jgi:cyclomaltodextrinase / maltogenic alpha-amylase / neopullulanase
LVTTATPAISAYIYPKVGTAVDTSTLSLEIDGTTYNGLGGFYDFATKHLSFAPPSPLPNGSHTVILRAGTNADTVTFNTQAPSYVQILTQGGYATLNSQRQLNGFVQNVAATSVKLVQNSVDTTTIPVSNGTFTTTTTLIEGLNTFKALADSSGTQVESNEVTFSFLVDHSPSAQITFTDGGATVQLEATNSTDPDSGQTGTLTFLWTEDPNNPSPIPGVNSSTAPTIMVSTPTVPGEYYFGLIATDVDGNTDTTRNYFTLDDTLALDVPTFASVPLWVRRGRMYEMFLQAQTPAGTFSSTIPDLDRIAAMGYNIIWVMPIMRTRIPIFPLLPGYEIVDFYATAPEYGTTQDFKNFVDRAHELGMKVILDITPNHYSSAHPFVQNAKFLGENSRYWNYSQHQIIPFNGPFLGQFGSPPNHDQVLTPDGFGYYGPFGDNKLNYNWADIDSRQYMLDVYKYWVKEIGVDGYRLDVYWGPHIRANSPNGGENEMGRPMREYLMHVRPDIYLFGEAQGVGVGTERLYADNSDFRGPGGVSSANDWELKNLIISSNFWTVSASQRVNNLDFRLRNGSATPGMGFLPGPNSFFVRFLENHDEDRVIYLFGTGVDSMTAMQRTMPVGTAVQLAVGMPMVYAGQEVGRGLGISDNLERRRGKISWNTVFAPTLMPHYQKLAQIRKQFVPFSVQQMVRVNSSVSGVYAYTRPYPGLNGIVVANLEGVPRSADVTLTAFTSPPSVQGVVNGVTYFATDLYNGNAVDTIVFTGGNATLTVDLPAYGSAVFVLDDKIHALQLPPLTGVDDADPATVPDKFTLDQNYPNPFNPTTTIRFQLPQSSDVVLTIYDLLGREVAKLVEGEMNVGVHVAEWDGRRSDGMHAGSGVYFYRLKAGSFTQVKKMLLLK